MAAYPIALQGNQPRDFAYMAVFLINRGTLTTIGYNTLKGEVKYLSAQLGQIVKAPQVTRVDTEGVWIDGVQASNIFVVRLRGSKDRDYFVSEIKKLVKAKGGNVFITTFPTMGVI